MQPYQSAVEASAGHSAAHGIRRSGKPLHTPSRINYRGTVDNRLAHMDQASYLGARALGYGAQIQFTWIYNRPINIDGLRRFHRNLGHGLLGRRIERSPLPFARDRWVHCPGPEDVEIAETPRPRADLIAWSNARARLPLDPEYGPSWHLGVLPLEDGGTAVCLAASHTVIDGLGIIQAMADAASGRTHHLGYPHPGSRTRRQAVLQDARQTIAATPELARAAVATAQFARKSRHHVAASIASAPPPPRVAGDEQPLVVPAVNVFADLAEWDACAESIGGNGNTLLAGIACRLGVRMGRVCDDGTVTLSFPISVRTENDTRGNALVFPSVSVDPTRLTSDLAEIRVRLKQALANVAETTDRAVAPLPLASMTPRWAARRAAGIQLGAAGLPVGCSNVTDMAPASNRPDGTDADYMTGRLVEPGVTKRTLERIGGQLFVASGRVHGKVTFSVTAYRPDRSNTQEALREQVLRTLDEFGVGAEIHG
jgi:hypothetical protein